MAGPNRYPDLRFDKHCPELIRGVLWGLGGRDWGFVDAPDFVWQSLRSASCRCAVDKRSFEGQILSVLLPLLELWLRRASTGESA